MLRYRLLVAVVGIPIGLAAIILGGYFLLALALVLTVLGLHEYYTLLRPYQPNLLVGFVAGTRHDRRCSTTGVSKGCWSGSPRS